ncbi:flagella synthesis protein FlgN [Oxalobacteraceae bacterium GrIS 2.11]
MNNLLICIQNESDAMANLVTILMQEQNALTQAPSLALMEEISAITQQKNQLIANISLLGQIRKNELTRLGFQHNEATMPTWLQDQAQIDCWSLLIKHTKKANELNRVNGLLINKHLLRNQTTLQVLYKHQRNDSAPSLYGSNGQSSARRGATRGFVV